MQREEPLLHSADGGGPPRPSPLTGGPWHARLARNQKRLWRGQPYPSRACAGARGGHGGRFSPEVLRRAGKASQLAAAMAVVANPEAVEAGTQMVAQSVTQEPADGVPGGGRVKGRLARWPR